MEVIKGYDFDDVLLVPKVTQLGSRSEVNDKDAFGKYPIFISPMKGISGAGLLRAGIEANVYGYLHRFYNSLDEREEVIYNIAKENRFNLPTVGVAVGLSEAELTFAKMSYDLGVEHIVVDVANGYLQKVADFVQELYRYGYKNIMAGNVVTKEGADLLSSAGSKFIRVGIGSGGLCTTRNVTGVGYPQLSAIDDVNLSERRDDFYIVADGGISNSGNAVKAFACGADYVMIGSYFAQALESDHDGEIYGMASRRLQEEYHGEVKSVEGIEKKVSKTAPLKELVEDFMAGIRSACTYLNSDSYLDLEVCAKFVTTGKGTLK